MLCPNCGTQTTNEQKFCRNCGMNLEPVSKALAAHLSQEGLPVPPPAREAERLALRRMATGLIWGIGVLLIGILLLSMTKVFALRPGYKMLGLFVTLLGTFISVLAVLWPLRSAARRHSRAPRPGALEGERTTGRLLGESTIEPAASVTERTTDLLGVEVKRARPRQE